LEYIKKDIHKRIEELHIDANVGLFGRQYRVPKNDIPTEAYQLLSLSSALYLHNGLELTLTGNNLLNTSYFSNLSRYKIIGLPEPGRSVVVRLNYTFRKKSA
jgi:iron complex outermembrane receptor protein